MRFEVTILGNGSASPVPTRHQTGQVLNVREQYFLVDCGEGTQERLMRVGISPQKLNALFISHIHGDHIYGLMPLISGLGLAGKKTPLRIFGPPGVGRLLDFFQNDFGRPVDFSLDFQPVDTTGSALVFENRSVEVWNVPLRHRVATTGWIFREKTDPVGTVPRSYAFLSDTLPSPKAASIVRELVPDGVDLMYHEATFSASERRQARDTGHSTAGQAAKIAAAAGAKKLLIGHFSSRYKDLGPLLAEAREVFPETFIAEEGEVFSVPAAKTLPL